MSDRPLKHTSGFHLVTSAVLGVAVAVALGVMGHMALAPMAGWTVLAAGMSLQTWLKVRKMDGNQTEEHSQQKDSSAGFTHTLMILGTLGSLVGVGFLLAAGSDKGANGALMGGVGLVSIVASWFLVHLLFMLRYARLYYGDGNRGLEIGDEDQPDYQDFAYLSFCLGMTYQVSDQNTKNKLIRRTVLHHTLLSYLLGAVVVGCTINLLVQLASSN